MARFEKKWQQNNKSNDNQEKHSYVFKVLHNGLKPTDREKMLRVLHKEDDNFALQK